MWPPVTIKRIVTQAVCVLCRRCRASSSKACWLKRSWAPSCMCTLPRTAMQRACSTLAAMMLCPGAACAVMVMHPATAHACCWSHAGRPCSRDPGTASQQIAPASRMPESYSGQIAVRICPNDWKMLGCEMWSLLCLLIPPKLDGMTYSPSCFAGIYCSAGRSPSRLMPTGPHRASMPPPSPCLDSMCTGTWY